MSSVDCNFIITIFIVASILPVMMLRNEKVDEMSRLLELMLKGYDRRIRPDYGNEPLTVVANLNLRSMGPISELDMVYSMDCYFRQTWRDRRLAMNISLENVTLGIKILERIWHPDSVFFNGRNSYHHHITTPNKFLRISQDGTVLFSQRITVRATCNMNLKTFPMDVQDCPLYIGSFAYTTRDVLYRWRQGGEGPVAPATDLRLSQFDLIGVPASNYTAVIKRELRSVLMCSFVLSRHTGYFLIQVYVPCCLLVVLSWVSFWINREATADRITIGTMAVLTMTILGIENRAGLPKVSYITALDLYIALCFVFVLASTLEFAFVHHFTKYGTGEPLLLATSDEESSEDETAMDEQIETDNDIDLGRRSSLGMNGGWNHNRRKRERSIFAKLCTCLTRGRVYSGVFRTDKTVFSNSVSKVDRASRILFPLVFIVLNVIYWVAFMR